MKRTFSYLSSIWVLALMLAGCESKAGTGALVGGGLGAGTGALIGGGQGALIGGAVGIVGGAIVGHILDEQDKENIKKENTPTMREVDNEQNLTVDDIIVLHRSGVSDDKICFLPFFIYIA